MPDLSWFVTIASITGTVANACKKRWGFLIWMFTNTFWIIYDIHYGLYAQASLYVVNFILAVTGFILWGKQAKKRVIQQNISPDNEMTLPGGITLKTENYGDDEDGNESVFLL